MQGYIIHIAPQKNEDIILSILTPQKIKKLYRFYGARHSVLQLGKKIDFETENNGIFMPKLRNITALNFHWEKDLQRIQVWQRYIQLLYKHFQGIEEVDNFYFNMLEKGATKLILQNPYRVALEMYATLLDFEGRTPSFSSCFLCSKPLQGTISLTRSFLPVHTNCISSTKNFSTKNIHLFLEKHSTLNLEDEEINYLWKILLQGI